MRRLFIALKNIATIPLRLFQHISIFAVIQDSDINKHAAICMGTKFYRSKIGKYSYVGRNCFINNTKIGNFSSIAEGCFIGGTSHPLNWVSTSSVFHKWDNLCKKNFSRHEYDIFQETIIGNDVWIGTNALVKAGITISDGAVIGMGSIVTKDVGPYEIWAGNPAKIIGKRFDENTIEQLLIDKWWQYNDVYIEKKAKYFKDPQIYLKNLDEKS